MRSGRQHAGGLVLILVGYRVAQVLVASLSTASQSPVPAPEATISAKFAQFVFPADSTSQYVWDVPGPTGYAGRPDYSWEVHWEEGPEGKGRVPFALTLVVRWRGGGPHSGSLARMLAGRQADVLVFCMACGTPAALDHRDRAIQWSLEGNRVSLTVRGSEAVRRVFPTLPQRVTFTKRRKDAPEEEWNIPVTPLPGTGY
jgi:hypothetical protein